MFAASPPCVALLNAYPAGLEDEIVRGAIDYAQHQTEWTLLGHGHRPFMPLERVDLATTDGVIGHINSTAWIDAATRAGVMAVNCSTQRADLALPRVGHDDVAIGRMGGRHLLERGFEHFAFVQRSEAWYARRRLAGFREVIEQEAGRPCLHYRFAVVDEQTQSALLAWLRGLPPSTAVMAANDDTALIVIQTANAAGLRVPEDVAVLGVDHDQWASTLSPVSISSVVVNARQIGYAAARMLDQLLSGRELQPASPHWVPPVEVVTKGSTDMVVQPDPAVRDALHFIREHCAEGITVSDVLDSVDVSRRTLENRLKRATGRTLREEIQKAQIDRACRVMIRSQLTLGEVAFACGFQRQEQFNRVFKRLTGLTPGDYRQSRSAAAGSVA